MRGAECASPTTNLDINGYPKFIHCGVISFFVFTFFLVKQLALGRIIFFTCFFSLLKSAWAGGCAPPDSGVKVFFSLGTSPTKGRSLSPNSVSRLMLELEAKGSPHWERDGGSELETLGFEEFPGCIFTCASMDSLPLALELCFKELGVALVAFFFLSASFFCGCGANEPAPESVAVGVGRQGKGGEALLAASDIAECRKMEVNHRR